MTQQKRPVGTSEDEKKDALVEGFENDRKQYFHLGRLSRMEDLWMSIIAIFASGTSATLASLRISGQVAAVLAAIPAVIVPLQRKFNLREQSKSYFLLSAHLRALALELKHAVTPDLADFARRRGELEVKMEADLQRRD